MPMHVCHILLGRPWKYDIEVVHDGRKNTYSLEKDGKRHTLSPLKDEEAQEGPSFQYFFDDSEGVVTRSQERRRTAFFPCWKTKGNFNFYKFR